jgi:hypothetical protein
LQAYASLRETRGKTTVIWTYMPEEPSVAIIGFLLDHMLAPVKTEIKQEG